MPEFVLNRNATVRTTNGVVSFIKGQPTLVPGDMVRDVIAIGGIRADGAEQMEAEKPSLPEAPVGDARKEDLFAAFALIAERNESKDFTGQGVPTIKAVEKVVGFDVDRSEVVEAWAEYKIAKAEEE